MGTLYYLPAPPKSLTPLPPELQGYGGPVFKGADKHGQPVMFKADGSGVFVILWADELKLHEQECRQ